MLAYASCHAMHAMPCHVHVFVVNMMCHECQQVTRTCAMRLAQVGTTANDCKRLVPRTQNNRFADSGFASLALALYTVSSSSITGLIHAVPLCSCARVFTFVLLEFILDFHLS